MLFFWRSDFLSFCSPGHSSHRLRPWNSYPKLPWQDIDRFLLRFSHLIPEMACSGVFTSSRLLRVVLFILKMAPLIENQRSTKQPIALARLAIKEPSLCRIILNSLCGRFPLSSAFSRAPISVLLSICNHRDGTVVRFQFLMHTLPWSQTLFVKARTVPFFSLLHFRSPQVFSFMLFFSQSRIN